MNRGLLWRAFICVCCGVFSQTSGNGLVSSYLPEILASAGITQTKTVTLINGCNSIWSWLVAIICALLTPRLRRRTTFLTGMAAMLTFFVGWTIAQARYDITGVQGAGYAVLALIFLNNAAYSYCWLFLVCHQGLFHPAADNVTCIGHYIPSRGCTLQMACKALGSCGAFHQYFVSPS